MPRRKPADVPVLPWSEWWPLFASEYRVAKDSADHVTIIGPTGTGKTTVAMHIASLRRFVIVLGCKPEDENLARLAAAQDFHRIGDDRIPSHSLYPKVLCWPPYRGLADVDRQRRVFESVFDQAFSAGGWHIVTEEMPYLVDELGMRDRLKQHLRMGRSVASGLISCAQRPVGIPLEALSNAQHLIIFGTNDTEDLKRLAGLNGADPWQVRDTVARLGRGSDDNPDGYRFLHVNTRTGTLRVSRYEPSKGNPT